MDNDRQRILGSILVPLWGAVAILGVLSGIVAADRE
jgi:hypothetical protein